MFNVEASKGTAQEVLSLTLRKQGREEQEQQQKQEVPDNFRLKRKAEKFGNKQEIRRIKQYFTSQKYDKEKIAFVKIETCEKMYEELETFLWQKNIYQLDKSRNKATKNMQYEIRIKNAEKWVQIRAKKSMQNVNVAFRGILNEKNEK